MPAERKRIVVIGGGISGLAAAYRLKRGAQQRGLPLDVTLPPRFVSHPRARDNRAAKGTPTLDRHRTQKPEPRHRPCVIPPK